MLQSWLDRYYRFTPLEAQGRLYELCGIRLAYLFISRRFGEEALPALASAQSPPASSNLSLDRATLAKTRNATRYHEMVNALYAVLSALLVAFLFPRPPLALLGYGVALFGIHLLCALQERYKRALCDRLLLLPPEAFSPALPKSAAATPPSSFLFPFESVSFYRALGVERFRQFVLWVTALTAPEETSENASRRTAFVAEKTPKAALAYALQTQISERIHLLGILLHLPFLCRFWQIGATAGLLYTFALQIFNAYCALLQRYHRVRIMRLLRRTR